MRFVGHVIGSGERGADPVKVATVQEMKIPETKKQVIRLIGFLSYFRDYITNFSQIAEPLTNLTGKRIPNQIPWGKKENDAFEELKSKLCHATLDGMKIADFNRPYVIEVDSSQETIGAALMQNVEGQGDKPIAFASQKLTLTQRAWSTIEKEAYAAI